MWNLILPQWAFFISCWIKSLWLIWTQGLTSRPPGLARWRQRRSTSSRWARPHRKYRGSLGSRVSLCLTIKTEKRRKGHQHAHILDGNSFHVWFLESWLFGKYLFITCFINNINTNTFPCKRARQWLSLTSSRISSSWRESSQIDNSLRDCLRILSFPWKSRYFRLFFLSGVLHFLFF